MKITRVFEVGRTMGKYFLGAFKGWASVATIVLAGLLPIDAAEYEVDLLPDFQESLQPGHVSCGVRAINNRGQIVGAKEVFVPSSGYRKQALLREPDGTLIDIGDFSSTGVVNSIALTINDLGEIAGWSDGGGQANGVSATRAFVWDPVNGIQDLGSVKPGNPTSVSMALDINDAREVAGWSSGGTLRGPNTYYSSHAAFWSPQSGWTDVGAVLGGDWDDENEAFVVDQRGRVLLKGVPLAGNVLWDFEGGFDDLGGAVQGHRDFNGCGQIMGYSSVGAYLWDPRFPELGMQPIGLLPGYSTISPSAINNRGQIAGFAYESCGWSCRISRGFLWDPAEGMVELDPLTDLAEVGPFLK